MKRTPLKRKTPLRRVSPKRAQVNRSRAAFVKEQLAARELCEAGAKIHWAGHQHRCSGVAVDIHEPLTRARGGDILDPANTIAVCRAVSRLDSRQPGCCDFLRFTSQEPRNPLAGGLT